MSAALSTHQLTKSYGDRPALLPLDLEVPHGQHVALGATDRNALPGRDVVVLKDHGDVCGKTV